MYQQITQVPNVVFDIHLPSLTESELKLLLVIIRQTFGWFDKATGQRKTRDRISHGQFMKKTGLSRRVITKALKSLIDKNLVTVTCENGKTLHQAVERKGVSKLFYSFLQEPVRHKVVPMRMYGVKTIGSLLIQQSFQFPARRAD